MTTSSSALKIELSTSADGEVPSMPHLDLALSVGTDVDRPDASLFGTPERTVAPTGTSALTKELAAVEGVIVEVSSELLAVKLLDRDTVMDLPRVLYVGQSEPRYGIPVCFRVYQRANGTRFQCLEEQPDVEAPSVAFDKMKLLLKDL